MSHRNHRKKGEQENGCILLLSFASVFINPTGINWEKSVKNMTLNFKSPQISHNRKLNKIKEEKRWNVNVVEVVAAEEAEHTGTLLVHHLPLYTRINEAGKRKTEKRKKERGEKNKFLWFIYDAMKACWTHQNRQQWSDCQRRWSVFIVEQAREREREEQSLRLCCGRVLTISLPCTPKLQTTRTTISCLINISQSNTCAQRIAVIDTIDIMCW